MVFVYCGNSFLFLDLWLSFVLVLALKFRMGWGASKNRLANRMVCQTPFVVAPPRETWRIREEERGSIEKESEGEDIKDQEKRRYTQRTEKKNDALTNFKVEQGAG